MTIRFRASAASLLLACLAAWGQAPSLPEGEGRKAVEARCVRCHDLATITRSGYSREGWLNDIAMMRNVGAQVSDAEGALIADYLASNLPEKPQPAAVVLPRAARIEVQEWALPTPGSRPHDPLATPDGMLWYTAQFNNALGRLEPKSGAFKEFPLKTPGSGPHGLIADRDGNIWFTANFKAYIGKLDPKSGAITEYPMPDPAAKDPHTPIFAANGNLSFTRRCRT